jgi:uncharacterized membrane protein
MEKDRLGTFSDGVIAIILTIMVLELKAPADTGWTALREIIPDLLSYVLSFIYVAIYWNNHHHLLHTVERVNGAILWANMHLLFWMSLIPLTTAWVRENHYSTAPTAIYGVVLLLCAVAYFVLQITIVHAHGENSLLKRALGRDLKGKLSPPFYLTGIIIAFVSPFYANIIYAAVACIWLIPDRRIEKAVTDDEPSSRA